MIFSNRLLATTSLITLIVVVAAASASSTNAVVKSSRESGVRRRATTAIKKDFTIKCQTDHIVVMVKDQLPSTINRSCTISTYGTFSDSISLSCSSLAGIGCKIKPSSVLISDNPSYVDNITVTIAIDNGILLTTTIKETEDIVVSII